MNMSQMRKEISRNKLQRFTIYILVSVLQSHVFSLILDQQLSPQPSFA